MAWKKKEKRIVSSAGKEASVLPTIKKSLISEDVINEPLFTDKQVVARHRELNEEAHRAEVRHRVGLNYELLCERVRDGLNAEMAILDSEGKIVNKVPANSERAKFIQAAIDILGAKKADVGAQKIPSIIIVLPTGERLN